MFSSFWVTFLQLFSFSSLIFPFLVAIVYERAVFTKLRMGSHINKAPAPHNANIIVYINSILMLSKDEIKKKKLKFYFNRLNWGTLISHTHTHTHKCSRNTGEMENRKKKLSFKCGIYNYIHNIWIDHFLKSRWKIR